MRLPRLRFTVRHLMGTVALFAVIYGVFVGSLRVREEVRRAANAAGCSSRLKQIALALQSYHEAYGCFPPAYLADSRGRPVHSWRVLILPFIDEATLYNSYNFAEPWDGPRNSRLARSKPETFACPNGRDAWGQSFRTNYLAVAGPGTAFPGCRPASVRDVRDGAAQTIMVAESANTGIHWMEPRDLDVGAMSFVINDPSRPSISSPDPKGPHVSFVDGSRRELSPSLAPETVRALTTISGGEPVSLDWDR
jgi:hypothetical protein